METMLTPTEAELSADAEAAADAAIAEVEDMMDAELNPPTPDVEADPDDDSEVDAPAAAERPVRMRDGKPVAWPPANYYVTVNGDTEFASLIEAAAGDVPVASWLRGIVAAHLGYTLPDAETRRKYASKDERKAAQAKRNKAKRDAASALIATVSKERGLTPAELLKVYMQQQADMEAAAAAAKAAAEAAAAPAEAA